MRFNRNCAAFVAALGLIAFTTMARGDGPADNSVDQVRRIPKLGVEVPEADRAEMTDDLRRLGELIERLKASTNPLAKELLPDVLIYQRAVDQALRYQEFFDLKEIPVGKSLLKQGLQRADQLLSGEAPWTKQTGLVVRGYISKIDKTVQPYGLVIPATYKFDGTEKHRLDFWFHGRDEVLSEVKFLNDRTKNAGSISPQNTIVLHPYGRFCNANKLAGEVDLFEALAAAKTQYRIDPDRIAVRGFSMGGAACWQFAVHYPDQWFAANPGAGFSETPLFLKVFQNEKVKPTAYEEKLWRLYDCPGYAANLVHLPTIAYSGEEDQQKQAADVMAEAFEREGMKLTHIIGPKTKHSIHPDSAKEIDARLMDLAVKGIDRTPSSIQFVTYTLKYNHLHWLTIDGMQEHWEEARISVKPVGDALAVTTKGVTAFTIHPPAGLPKKVSIDGHSPISLPGDGAFVLEGSTWKPGRLIGLHKKSGLQGPIDDALMDSFIFVEPSGACRNELMDKWVKQELDHAVTHWRRQFRGDAVVKRDQEITDQDIAQNNLILWGDPQANSLIARIADQLPIQWTSKEIKVGEQAFNSDHHTPIAVYPNPLNPEKYVVLNSSFTFREYDYLNNARQVPKLPDWAVVNLQVPPNSRFPGKIEAADFFGEKWEIKPQK